MAEQVLRADRPDRAGMKTMVTYLPPEVAKQFKVIAAQTDRTMQEIGEEALMQWLERHNKLYARGANPVAAGKSKAPKYAAPDLGAQNPEGGGPLAGFKRSGPASKG